MKACPFCAELIQDDAKKCRFCNEWLEDKPSSNKSSYIDNISNVIKSKHKEYQLKKTEHLILPTQNKPVKIRDLIIKIDRIEFKQYVILFHNLIFISFSASRSTINFVYQRYMSFFILGKNEIDQNEYRLIIYDDFNTNILGSRLSKKEYELLELMYVFISESSFETRYNNYITEINSNGFFQYDEYEFWGNGQITKDKKPIANLKDEVLGQTVSLGSSWSGYRSTSENPFEFSIHHSGSDIKLFGLTLGEILKIETIVNHDVFVALITNFMKNKSYTDSLDISRQNNSREFKAGNEKSINSKYFENPKLNEDEITKSIHEELFPEKLEYVIQEPSSKILDQIKDAEQKEDSSAVNNPINRTTGENSFYSIASFATIILLLIFIIVIIINGNNENKISYSTDSSDSAISNSTDTTNKQLPITSMVDSITSNSSIQISDGDVYFIKEELQKFYELINKREYDSLSQFFAARVNKYYQLENINSIDVIKEIKNYNSKVVYDAISIPLLDSIKINTTYEKIIIEIYLVELNRLKKDDVAYFYVSKNIIEYNSDYKIISLNGQVIERGMDIHTMVGLPASSDPIEIFNSTSKSQLENCFRKLNNNELSEKFKISLKTALVEIYGDIIIRNISLGYINLDVFCDKLIRNEIVIKSVDSLYSEENEIKAVYVFIE